MSSPKEKVGGRPPLAEAVKAKVTFGAEFPMPAAGAHPPRPIGDWNSLSLGLDKLHDLTTGTPTPYEVRVDLQTANESAYAVYDFFQVASGRERYRLAVGKYRGTAGKGRSRRRGASRSACVQALVCRGALI